MMKRKDVCLLVMMLCMIGLAAQAQQVSTITSDADTYIRDGTVRGAENFLNIYGGGDNHVGYVRFDLGAINVTQVLDAQLVLRNSGTGSRNDVINEGRFSLHGMNNVAGNTPQDWDEAVLAEDNVGDEFSNGVVLEQVTNLDADDGAAITEDIVGEGENYWDPGYYTITISGQDLIDFLQTRADDDGLATFIIACEATNGRGYGLCSKEYATVEWHPALTLTYIAGGATNPKPADMSTVTDLNLPELKWQNTHVDRAYVWFGSPEDANEVNFKDILTLIDTIDAPDPCESTPIPAGSLPLAVPDTYFWVVETYKYPDSDPQHLGEPNQLISNNVWEFYTSAVPITQTEPADQFKFPDIAETATFSVQFEGLTPVTDAEWYQDGVDVETINEDDVTISIVHDGGNLYTVTLTVENVVTADDGAYTCVAINSGGSSAPSASAELVVKRRLAYWKFEDTLDDEEGNYHGTVADPCNPIGYSAGFTGAASSLGQALSLDGSSAVSLPAGFDNFKPGMTIVVWANPSSAASWARFIDLGNGPGVDNIFLTRQGTTDTLTFNNNEGVVEVAGTIALNEWQMFAATVDEAGNVVLYKNGLPVQTGVVGVPAVVERTSNFIGDSNYEGDAFYAGLLDEISVYNYPITDDQIADMYSGVYGDYCRFPETVGNLDLSGNCIVDLPDFEILANGWLNCGLYPSCE